MHGSERVFDGLVVSQTGTGGATVDVSAGAAAIAGDDESNQGFYFVEVVGGETSNTLDGPGSGDRTDTLILRVNDATAGGLGTPVDDAVLELIEGVDVPNTAIALAQVRRSAGNPILASDISDMRPLGPWPYGVGTGGPPAVGVEGDLYIQVS
jgi:hypothetical protein